jgi:hypothetical protein
MVRAALFARTSPLSAARVDGAAISRQHIQAAQPSILNLSTCAYGAAARVVGAPFSLMMKTKNVAGRV